MKRILLLVTACIFVASTSFAQYSEGEENYVGMINQDEKIVLHLTPKVIMSGHTMTYSGAYQNASTQRDKLTLEGRINMDTGRFSFVERDEEGKVIGHFLGVRKGKTVQGTWRSIDKKEEVPFTLTKKS
ncbi:MAG: hypothetical protein ACFB0B_21945 [Thermonemataceae bacterium]